MDNFENMDQFPKTPTSYDELKNSYNKLYQGWMGSHKNIKQANLMLDLLDVKPGKKLIDIACGMGYVLDIAAERKLYSIGIDLSEVALEIAKSKNSISTDVVLGVAEGLPFRSESFDYVIILGSLEHFLDPATAVREAARILRPGAKAAVLVPNSHHIRTIYNVWKFGEVITDDQEYERYATRKEWEHMFTTNGFTVRSVHKFDVGMARKYKKGRIFFWYLYNILFHLFGNIWIPLNLTYTFIFILESGKGENPGT